MGQRGRRSGFSLLELVVAVSILAILALGFVALISSSQQFSSMTQERATAQAAVRAYVEAMRGKSLQQVFSDTTTPADYLGTATLGNPKVKPIGEVWKGYDETGATALYHSGTKGLPTTTSSVSFIITSSRLGFPIDLNADGTTLGVNSTGSGLVVLPAYVKLSWASLLVGSRQQKTTLVTTPNAFLDAYVCFGQP